MEIMMVVEQKISLMLADVNGTLVNEETFLTKRAQSALWQPRRAGIRFAINSGRPPLGIPMLFDLDRPGAHAGSGQSIKRVSRQTAPTFDEITGVSGARGGKPALLGPDPDCAGQVQ
jgi:haloacid dehalogenase-like hydrolase